MIGGTIAGMDDGHRLRQLTELSQQDKKRFELEWVLPLEPDLETHVRLYDLEKHPPQVVAMGHGADEPATVLHCGPSSPLEGGN